MKSFGLLRVAAEAELIRIRALLKRQARRGAYGGIAGLFAIAVLALIEVLAWQALRLLLESIATTAVLLGINVVITAIFVLLASRSVPGQAESEARRLRDDALSGARNSLMITGAVLAGRGYLARRRRRRVR